MRGPQQDGFLFSIRRHAVRAPTHKLNQSPTFGFLLFTTTQTPFQISLPLVYIRTIGEHRSQTLYVFDTNSC